MDECQDGWGRCRWALDGGWFAEGVYLTKEQQVLDVVFDYGGIRPHCMRVSVYIWMIRCAACVLVPLVCLFACLGLSWSNTMNKRLSKYHVVVCTCLLLHAVLHVNVFPTMVCITGTFLISSLYAQTALLSFLKSCRGLHSCTLTF